jgi:hypothetical protein
MATKKVKVYLEGIENYTMEKVEEMTDIQEKIFNVILDSDDGDYVFQV